MLTATLSHFWPAPARAATTPEPPRKRLTPIFIGDAVQPWAGETMLLAILRQDAEGDDPMAG
jgi:hypothetical protein